MTCPHHGEPVIADDGRARIVQSRCCTNRGELLAVFTCDHFNRPATERKWKHKQREIVCNECELWPMRADDER